MLLPLIEKQFDSGEGLLSYVQGPSNGPPILLLHGAASRWQPFQSILPALAEKHQVFALDLRGHGRSSHTPEAYHIDDFSGDIQQFILQKVRAPVAIYGHSLGGLIAINLAARHPESVCAVILGDPPLYYHDTLIRDTFWLEAFQELLDFINDHPTSVEREAWLVQNMPSMTPERRAERVRSLEGLDPQVLQAIIDDEQMKGVSLPALASRVTCPVLLLRGNPELGSALREQDVEFALRDFSDIQVLEMESIGHGIVPIPLLPQVLAFLESIKT